jgi:hypothetical protein
MMFPSSPLNNNVPQMKKTLTLLLVLMSSTFTIKAQNWGGGVDDRKIHFGFTFQYIASEYKVSKVADWRRPAYDIFDPTNPFLGLNRITPRTTPGFGIGVVVNNRLGSNLDLRLTPTLAFANRELQYVFAGEGNNYTQKVKATMVDFPLDFKVKSDRRKNYRAYLVGGLKYSMDVTSAKKTSNEGKSAIDMVIQNRKNFLSYQAGLGLDLYFEYFKMSPEIKYSASFNNLLKPEANNLYSRPLDKLMLRNVTFSLFFE